MDIPGPHVSFWFSRSLKGSQNIQIQKIPRWSSVAAQGDLMLKIPLNYSDKHIKVIWARKRMKDYILKFCSESLCFHNNRYFCHVLEVCKLRLRRVEEHLKATVHRVLKTRIMKWFVIPLKDELPRSVGAQYATEISGEITPERMKRWSQSKNNTQLWMWLVIDARSDGVKSNIA